MSTHPASRTLGVATAAIVPAVAVAMILFVGRTFINGNGDSLAVIHGAHLADACIGRGQWTDCGQVMGPYALLQYLVAAFYLMLGLSDEHVLKAFGYTSAVAFVGMLGLAIYTMRRLGRPALGSALAILVIVSPLPWYGWSTFGESTGALACMAFLAAALLRAPIPVLAVTLIIAGQTKETALPFLLLAGAGALYWSPVSDRPLRRAHWITGALASFVSLALTAGFNLFRFDQVTNAVYADPIAHTQGLEMKVKFAVSIWVAPNAGVLSFWPVAVILFLAAVFLGVRGLRGPLSDRRRVVGATVILLLCLAGLTAGYASWYAPFGWIAWGPRLMLLMVPALALFAVGTLAPEFERLLLSRTTLAKALGSATAVVALVAWWPQLGVLHDSGVMGSLFTPDATCPVQQPIGVDPGYYYTCIFHWAW
jgi:hypothetical protein